MTEPFKKREAIFLAYMEQNEIHIIKESTYTTFCNKGCINHSYGYPCYPLCPGAGDFIANSPKFTTIEFLKLKGRNPEYFI